MYVETGCILIFVQSKCDARLSPRRIHRVGLLKTHILLGQNSTCRIVSGPVIGMILSNQIQNLLSLDDMILSNQIQYLLSLEDMIVSTFKTKHTMGVPSMSVQDTFESTPFKNVHISFTRQAHHISRLKRTIIETISIYRYINKKIIYIYI
jgi:hypothetical protein